MRKRTDTHKNVALGILLGIVLVAGLVFGALVLFAPKDEGTTPGDDSEVVDDSYVSKDEQDDIPTAEDSDAPSDSPVEDQAKKSLNIGVDADYNGGVIEAFSTVYGTVDISGKCTYVFVAPDGRSYEVGADVLAGPNTVTCAKSEYRSSMSGTWKVSLKYETDKEVGNGNATVSVP